VSTHSGGVRYPLFLDLRGRRVLVVGGGPVALEKAREIAAHGAELCVVSPELRPGLAELAAEVRQRGFEPSDVDGAFFIIAAAPPPVNRDVRRAAEARARFVVAVDDVESCTAYGAARLVRGGLSIAISSDGRAPALVALLRRAIESVLPDDLEAWTALAEAKRNEWKAKGVPFMDRRPLLLRALGELYEAPKSEASS
jgi:siroheme synthase-like protein